MIKPTTPPEIEDIISKIATSKGTGPYSISQQLIKSVKTSISTQLPNLFNMSFIEGQWPSFLKLSSVIPIYKKETRSFKLQTYFLTFEYK